MVFRVSLFFEEHKSGPVGATSSCQGLPAAHANVLFAKQILRPPGNTTS